MPKFSPLFTPFFLRSLLAAIGCSICGSIVGTYILCRRLTNLSGSLSHSLLSGLGLGIFLSHKGYLLIDPGTLCLFSSLVGGIILALAQNTRKYNEDSIATVLWVAGSALGLLFCSYTPTAGMKLGKYMMGNIIWVSNMQLKQLFFLNIFVLIITFFFHKRIICISIDQDFAQTRGIAVKTVNLALFATIALTVAMLTLIFGSLLVMAFINLPAMCAMKFAKNINQCILASLVISILGATAGLFISLYTDTPPSAATSLILTIFYSLSNLMNKF